MSFGTSVINYRMEFDRGQLGLVAIQFNFIFFYYKQLYNNKHRIELQLFTREKR